MKLAAHQQADFVSSTISLVRSVAARDILRSSGSSLRFSPSFFTGHAGLAFFYGSLPGNDFDEIDVAKCAQMHLSEALESLGEQDWGWTVARGYTGVLWAGTLIAAALDESFRKSLDSYRGEIYQILEVLFSENPDAEFCGRDENRLLCEHMYGLAGILPFLLAQPSCPKREALIERVVSWLDSLAKRGSNGIYWESWKRGEELWLGVAHGNAGVCAALGRALEHRIRHPKLRELYQASSSWLLAQIRTSGDRLVFPSSVCSRRNSETEENTQPRTGWCWGSLGMCAALLGPALRWSPVFAKKLVIVAEDAVTLPSDDRVSTPGTLDGGLCHGAAGYAHMLNRLHALTGREVFSAAAVAWYWHMLRCWQEQGSVAFQRNPDRPGDAWTDLLSGAPGTALAMLCSVHPLPSNWDSFLLLS